MKKKPCISKKKKYIYINIKNKLIIIEKKKNKKKKKKKKELIKFDIKLTNGNETMFVNTQSKSF